MVRLFVGRATALASGVRWARSMQRSDATAATLPRALPSAPWPAPVLVGSGRRARDGAGEGDARAGADGAADLVSELHGALLSWGWRGVVRTTHARKRGVVLRRGLQYDGYSGSPRTSRMKDSRHAAEKKRVSHPFCYGGKSRVCLQKVL